MMLITTAKQYERLIKRMFGGAASQIAGHQVKRLTGFWALWHMLGGDDGLRLVGITDRHIWRTHKEFKAMFGVAVDEFLPDMAKALQKAVKDES